MKITTLLICLLVGPFAFAVEPLMMNELTPAQQGQVQQVFQSLPPSFQASLNFSIKVKSKKIFHFSKNTKRLAQYNDITKTISISPEVFEDANLLNKTVIHELAHAYEFNVEKIYRIPEFQLTAGLHKRGIGVRPLKQRNFLENASVDSYEFKNMRESFPVNFESFMTDREFQCRKPLLNAFMEKHFQFSPFPKQTCNMVKKVPVTINNQLHYEEMDFSKLYEIHYLFASKGEEAMSRWGHSMIRLVFCAPHKTVKDETCLKDVAHHWVISFRANVQDIEINNIKGMTGKYPSEIFIFPMVEIIREYVKIELRDLVSVPLKTTPQQMERFKSHLLETSYAYQGKYRFFTVNCATETLNFLQIVMNDAALYKMQTYSPLKLHKKLMKTPFVNGAAVEELDQALLSGHYFKGQKSILEKSFTKISHMVREKSFDKYVEKSNSLRRKTYFEKQTISTNEWASIILLEKHLLEKYQKEFMEKVAKLVVDTLDKKQVPEAVKHLESLRLNIIENNAIKYDWRGYGIPFENEFQEPVSAALNLPESAAEEAQNWIKENFPKEQEELNSIINNIEEFTNQMTISIRRNK